MRSEAPRLAKAIGEPWRKKTRARQAASLAVGASRAVCARLCLPGARAHGDGVARLHPPSRDPNGPRPGSFATAAPAATCASYVQHRVRRPVEQAAEEIAFGSGARSADIVTVQEVSGAEAETLGAPSAHELRLLPRHAARRRRVRQRHSHTLRDRQGRFQARAARTRTVLGGGIRIAVGAELSAGGVASRVQHSQRDVRHQPSRAARSGADRLEDAERPAACP